MVGCSEFSIDYILSSRLENKISQKRKYMIDDILSPEFGKNVKKAECNEEEREIRENKASTGDQKREDMMKHHGINFSLDDKALCDLLLFGDSNDNVIINRAILEATISFIKSTKRFQFEFKHKTAATCSCNL